MAGQKRPILLNVKLSDSTDIKEAAPLNKRNSSNQALEPQEMLEKGVPTFKSSFNAGGVIFTQLCGAIIFVTFCSND